MDGVHPTHNTRSIKVWCRKGKEKIVKSNTGGQRININDAMNTIDSCDVIARSDERVNAQSTVELLKELLAESVSKQDISCL